MELRAPRSRAPRSRAPRCLARSSRFRTTKSVSPTMLIDAPALPRGSALDRTDCRDLGIADVPAAFDRAAATYDVMVNLNPGYHRHLQSAADALAESLPAGPALTVVDLGCGSGASTDALVNSMGHRGQPYTAIGVDGSAGMLAEARSKPWPTWVSFTQARAEDLSSVAESLPGLRGGAAGGNGSSGSPGCRGGARGVPVPQHRRPGRRAALGLGPARARRRAGGAGLLGGRLLRRLG